MSSLFPKATVQRNDFEEIARNHYRRNDLVVREDVEITLRQAAGNRLALRLHGDPAEAGEAAQPNRELGAG